MKTSFFLIVMCVALAGCGKVGALHPPQPDGFPNKYPSENVDE